MEERTPWTEHPKVMALRARHRAVDVAVEFADGFRRHRTGRSAALLGHYGFLSVFPLLLVFTTVVGFVLQDRPDLQENVIDSALASVPIIGQQLSVDPSGLRGSGPALIFGLLVALWAGLKAFVAMQEAMDNAWEIPLDARLTYVSIRLRAVAMILIIGVTEVASVVSTTLIVASDLAIGHRLLLLLVSIGSTVVMLTAIFQVLSTLRLDWRRQVLPGVVPATVAITAVQFLGTTIVARSIANASPTYGAFASVIALLSWLWLHAFITLFGAELNSARHRLRLVAEGSPPPAGSGDRIMRERRRGHAPTDRADG